MRMEIHIADEHQAVLARMQHIGEHLASERARLEAELRYVVMQLQRLENDLATTLGNAYGVDSRKQRVTLDMERGVITLPDVAPATAEPEPEPLSAASADGEK